MSKVVPTPPTTTTQAAADRFFNPSGIQPEMSTTTFSPRANYFVFSNNGQWQYIPVSGLTKTFDAETKKVVKLSNRIPVLMDGYACLTNRRVVKVTVDDIVRGRVCKFKVLSVEEVGRLTNGGRTDTAPAGGTGDGSAEVSRRSKKQAVQAEDDEGPGEIAWDEERSAADLALEEQMFSLLFKEDPQALRRIKNVAHTRQLVESGSVSAPDEDPR